MKKSVLTAFITVVCATSSVMAADDNAITDGKVTFNGKVIAPACTLVAATKDSVVTLPNVSATKLQTNGAVSGVKTDVPIALEGCDVTVTKNATFTLVVRLTACNLQHLPTRLPPMQRRMLLYKCICQMVLHR